MDTDCVRQSSPYQSRDCEVSGVHLLGQPVNFSPGVEKDHSLGDCQSFIQITQGVQLPLLSTIKKDKSDHVGTKITFQVCT